MPLIRDSIISLTIIRRISRVIVWRTREISTGGGVVNTRRAQAKSTINSLAVIEIYIILLR